MAITVAESRNERGGLLSWTIDDDGWWQGDVTFFQPLHEHMTVTAALEAVLAAVIPCAGDLDATIAALAALRGGGEEG